MKIGRVSGLLFSLIIVTTPVIAESDRDRNGGHGGSEAAQSANTIRVDAEIAKRMGIQVEFQLVKYSLSALKPQVR
jgi:hypothetical protein